MKALILGAALLSGCTFTQDSSTYFESALGINASKEMPWSQGQNTFEGPRDTIRFSIRHENGASFCSFSHISHLSAGFPFNDEEEDWLDMFECGMRVRL